MVSVLALLVAIVLAVVVDGDSLIWLGLTLFTLGLLPLAFALTRSAEGESGRALEKLTAPGPGAIALNAGSFFAQTGLLVTLIALVGLVV
jgi:hypothetical protein